MRDYSKIPSTIWMDSMGRTLRGDAYALVVRDYLLTTHHANMIGVYHCPLAYIAADTGFSVDVVEVAMGRLCDIGFCQYDDDTQFVWVRDMASTQVGAVLKENDKQIKAVCKQLKACPSSAMQAGFLDMYADAYSLPFDEFDARPLEAPSKALRSPLDAPSKPVTGAVAGPGAVLSPFQGDVLISSHARTHAREGAEIVRLAAGGDHA